MVEQKPSSVEDVVITAWILTHPHGDHNGAWIQFTKSAEYKDKITVKHLIGNDPSNYIQTHMSGIYYAFDYSEQSKLFAGCLYIKVHTGQMLFFPGVTVDILFTPEDIYPDFIVDQNSACTISFKATLNESETHEEMSFLFLADVLENGAQRMVEMYKEDLKCDVVQMGHHGNGGGSIEFYQLCQAKFVMWPIDEKAYTTKWEWERWPQTVWATENIETVILAWEGHYVFWFEESIDINTDFSGTEDANGDYSKPY